MPVRIWHDFFFRSIDVRQFALIRIGLGSLIVSYLIGFIPDFRDHFGPQGWLGAMQDLDLYHSGTWSVLFLTSSTAAAWAFLWISLIAAVAFTLGLLARFSGIITLIGLISLWNRNPLLMDGDDAILRIMLFYLLLSPCGNALSISALLRQRTQQAEIWPLRMIQIQLALVYFISGWVKFHSHDWLDGTILEIVLIHPEYSRWNLGRLMTDPALLTGLHATAFMIMWWEILFPFLILFPATRTGAITAGLVFHGGLLLFMRLRLFSVIMLVLYIAWIPPHFFRTPGARNLEVATRLD